MENKKSNIFDVSEIRKSFSEIRSNIDYLQRSLFYAEQTFINKYCELEQIYRTLLDEQLKQDNNGKVQDTK